jgi:hypothetical protein
VPQVPFPTRSDTSTVVEELCWDDPVSFHAESRAPRDDEPARGFLLRLHMDAACAARISPDHVLVAKRYEQAKATTLCPECTGSVVASSHSSVVRRLKEAERTLQVLLKQAAKGPMPRETVHCRALRHEAETTVSIHPEAAEVAARVIELAGSVAETLRQALARYESVR